MRRYLLVIGLLACSRHEDQAPAKSASACDKAQQEGQLAVIADDYPAALACAKERKVPLVIDEWAPWCHTCLSMQSTVFTDPSFKAENQRFVFAALDTDREVNAAPVARFPTSAWPTFYVLGPDESVLARFVGSASVAQFHAFLDSGARAMTGGAAGADARLLGAERAAAHKDYRLDQDELTAALAIAPADWPRRPDALVALAMAKGKLDDWAGCIKVMMDNLDSAGTAAPASDLLVTGVACAKEYAEKEGLAAAEPVQKVREAAVARWVELLAVEHSPLSVDDRSDALASLRETLDELGKKEEAHAVAVTQRAILDDAAGKAATPMAAMTYNWQRAEVYTYLGQGLDVVPALEKSAKDLPTEYDPPARLGWVYLKAGKLPEAKQWTDKALTMAYGPRKARLLGQAAEIAHRMNDAAAEKQARTQLVALWTGLPEGQQNPDALAHAKEELAKLP